MNNMTISIPTTLLVGLAFMANGCEASSFSTSSQRYLVQLNSQDTKHNNIFSTSNGPTTRLRKEAQQTVAAIQGVKTIQAYQNLNWMAVETEDEATLARIRANPDVLQVVKDQVVTAWTTTQFDPDWGLDWLDQTQGDDKYIYSKTGAGINVIIMDTGVRASHEEFDGHEVTCLYNAIQSESCNDLEGHGTYVASLAAGQQYGVAKEANILSVKVLDRDGSGATSGILDGVDRILDLVQENPTERYVVNMSFGGPVDSAMDDAARALVNANVVVTVAAGNEAENACGSSPARLSEAITVGAINDDNELASFSNFGSCVDIFAPGRDILGAGRSTDTSTYRGSGTSMSAPFVAGVVALYLEHDAKLSVRDVAERLLADAINVVEDPPSSTTTALVNTAAITEAGSCDEVTSFQFQATIRTDGYGNETYALLTRQQDGVPVAALLNLDNHESYELNKCLPKDCYAFQVFDLYGDGICSGYGDGSYTVNLNGEMIESGCDFEESAFLTFGNCTAARPFFVKPDPTAPPTSAPTRGCKPLVLTLVTDRFAYETEVHLDNVDTHEEIWHFDNLADSTTYTWEACLDTSSCYTLLITDSVGDGICCSYGNGELTITYDGETYTHDGRFGSWARFQTCPD